MAFTRITEDDLQGKGVIGQPEVPGLSALECSRAWNKSCGRWRFRHQPAGGGTGSGDRRGGHRDGTTAGMPEEVPAHVQGITAAHIENRRTRMG